MNKASFDKIFKQTIFENKKEDEIRQILNNCKNSTVIRINDNEIEEIMLIVKENEKEDI